MTQLKGHLPPPQRIEFTDLVSTRRPPLSTQLGWMKKAIRAKRFLDRKLFLKYSDFKIVSRQLQGGPAELLRLVLTFGDIKFRNEVIPEVDWKALIEKTPHGAMPVLWIDNEAYGEPNAIVRHMASHVGLMGEDADENLVVETVLHQVELLRDSDIIQKAYEELSVNCPDDNADVFLEEIVPANFSKWEARILNTPGPYIVASGVTLADLAIYDFVNQHSKYFPLDKELSKYTSLEYLCSSVPSQRQFNERHSTWR